MQIPAAETVKQALKSYTQKGTEQFRKHLTREPKSNCQTLGESSDEPKALIFRPV